MVEKITSLVKVMKTTVGCLDRKVLLINGLSGHFYMGVNKSILFFFNFGHSLASVAAELLYFQFIIV